MTDSGVNMEIQCRPRDLSTHDVFEIYRNRLEGETTAESVSLEYISESGYTIWSEWGLCTVKCGSGKRLRSRLHSNGNEETEEMSCNTSPCGKLNSSREPDLESWVRSISDLTIETRCDYYLLAQLSRQLSHTSVHMVHC